jgi:hypothetical protein
MKARVQQKIEKEDLDLFSEPCLSELKRESEVYNTQVRYPSLYFSYNAATRKATVLTTNLNGMHLRMVDRLKDYAKKPSQPEKFAFKLLFEWFSATLEYYKRVAEFWDGKGSGQVYVIPTATLDEVADLFATGDNVENSCEGVRP